MENPGTNTGEKDLKKRLRKENDELIKRIAQLEEEYALLKANSQSQQQAILDNMPHLAWLKDRNGRYVSVNESFCRFFNMKPSEIIGKTDFDICPGELAEDYKKKDLEVLKEKKPRLFYEIERSEKGKHYSETHKTPVLNENGEAIGIAGISRDITEQKLSEQALLQSEEKFKELVNLLPEVVFETDDLGNVTFVNLKGFSLMGYTTDDFESGVNIFDIIAPEDVKRARESFTKLKEGEELEGREYHIVSKSGSRIPVLVFTNNMFQDGRWIGLRGVVIDITNRKEAEKQEKKYQSKLLFLSNTALEFLSMAPDADIFDYIGQKMYEFINGAEVIVSSFDQDKSLLKVEYLSFSTENIKQVRELLEIPEDKFNILLTREHIEKLSQNAEHLYEFKGGLSDSIFGHMPKPVASMMQKMLNARKIFGMALMRSGKLYGSVVIIAREDKLDDQYFIETFIYQASIALHRRQLENELIIAKTHAEESDMLKTAFLANMSHEIRTPMNGILGLTQLLSKENLSTEDRQTYLDMINSNGNMLMNLVNDIIDISRIEANQIDLNETEFSLNELINDLKTFLHSEKTVKNIDAVDILTSKSFKDEDSFIVGDKNKLKQIFTNLIGNAMKFTNEGEIDFGYKLKNSDELLFYVRDTGIGISKEKLGLIFDRFIQADQSLTRPFGGSGLGLAISKGFVELMGGTIWVESEMNEGSIFYFTIPYKAAVSRKKTEDAPRKTIADFNWKNIKILVVEDNYVSFKLLEVSLKKTDIKILHAENGRQAIEMVKNHPDIDIVLMDIQLPLLNGYDATREIKVIRPGLPVIAQTANALDDDKQKCLDSGCSDYITKPIDIEKLFNVLDAYVQ